MRMQASAREVPRWSLDREPDTVHYGQPPSFLLGVKSLDEAQSL